MAIKQTGKGGGCGLQAAVQPKESEIPQEPQLLERHPLSLEATKELYEQWRLLETTYVDGLKENLGALAQNHARMRTHFKTAETDFCTWLRQPSEESTTLVQSPPDVICIPNRQHLHPAYMRLYVLNHPSFAGLAHAVHSICCTAMTLMTAVHTASGDFQSLH